MNEMNTPEHKEAFRKMQQAISGQTVLIEKFEIELIKQLDDTFFDDIDIIKDDDGYILKVKPYDHFIDNDDWVDHDDWNRDFLNHDDDFDSDCSDNDFLHYNGLEE